MKINRIFFLLLISITCASSCSSYTIKLFVGKEMEPLASFIAQQRVIEFSKYPYLYDATTQTDCDELSGQYSNLSDSAAAVAYLNNEPIAFLTGCSLTGFDTISPGAVDAFAQNEQSPEKYYYFPEIIISPEHRNKKLSRQLFNTLEQFAIERGYTAGCFITENYINHPLKPNGYKEKDPVWVRLGYTNSPITLTWTWQTFQADGSSKMQENSVIFWLKNFQKGNTCLMTPA